MKISRNSIVASILAIMVVAGVSHAGTSFRGLTKDQGNNLLFSDSLNRLEDTGNPFYIDILDNFGRDGALLGSDADALQIGFVPPTGGVPVGPLQGQVAVDHGRWSQGSEFVTSAANGGSVQRASMSGNGIASMPWRVEPTLGDYYQIEMTATVAAGENVSIGYLADVETISATQGLAGELGQLVLGVTRGLGADEDKITWTVSWDQEGAQQSVSNTISSPVGDELAFQLGWLDQGSDDLFDVWLGDSTGNKRLLQGNMNAAIDVYDIGFFAGGLESTIGSFTSAVPEPTTALMAAIGIIALIGMRRRS